MTPGTIVRVIQMDHLRWENDRVRSDRSPLAPPGMFAEIDSAGQSAIKGARITNIMVLTLPRSLVGTEPHRAWTWDAVFPLTDADGDLLEPVDEDTACAVRALVGLSDTLPVVVDDGWLC